ncbi:MAG: AAA family ATPase [Nitrososphaerota archaeon]|nr:AAA family ATPase [Nitrososphaerota archaeon]
MSRTASPKGGRETADLWTILVIGPPTSGKSRLARRLLTTVAGSVRINPDELRMMYFNDPAPVHDEELVYYSLTNLRKFALDHEHSVVIDSTAPRHATREFFLSDGNRSRHLVVLMDVDRKVLLRRAKGGGKLSPLKAFDSVWEEPSSSLPVFKFRNDDEEQFETSFFLLMEYINHEYTEHRSVLRSILRLRRRDDGLVRRGAQERAQPRRAQQSLGSGGPPC